MLSSKSLVLKPVADEDALFDEVERCVKGWHQSYDLFLLHDETLEDDESGVTTAIWRDPARPDFELRLVGDDEVPMVYVSVVPDEKADLETLLAELAKCFDVYQPDALMPEALSNPGDARAWTKLAIALNGRRDEQVESVLLANLSGLNADRLYAAAMAASLLCWPTLVEPLRAALARPIPEEARPALSLALKACEAREG
jgi:hypothetical protein